MTVTTVIHRFVTTPGVNLPALVRSLWLPLQLALCNRPACLGNCHLRKSADLTLFLINANGICNVSNTSKQTRKLEKWQSENPFVTYKNPCRRALFCQCHTAYRQLRRSHRSLFSRELYSVNMCWTQLYQCWRSHVVNYKSRKPKTQSLATEVCRAGDNQ